MRGAAVSPPVKQWESEISKAQQRIDIDEVSADIGDSPRGEVRGSIGSPSYSTDSANKAALCSFVRTWNPGAEGPEESGQPDTQAARARASISPGPVRRVTDALKAVELGKIRESEWVEIDTIGRVPRNMNTPALSKKRTNDGNPEGFHRKERSITFLILFLVELELICETSHPIEFDSLPNHTYRIAHLSCVRERPKLGSARCIAGPSPDLFPRDFQPVVIFASRVFELQDSRDSSGRSSARLGEHGTGWTRRLSGGWRGRPSSDTC